MSGATEFDGVLLEEGQTWEDLRAQCDRSAVRVEALCAIVTLGGAQVTVEEMCELTGRTAEDLGPALGKLLADRMVTCQADGGPDFYRATRLGYHEVELLRIRPNDGYHDSEPR